MPNSNDLDTEIRATIVRLLDRQFDGGYTADKARTADMLTAVRVHTPPAAAGDGPIVVDLPDTASARLYGRQLLLDIVTPTCDRHGIRSEFRSDTSVQVRH